MSFANNNFWRDLFCAVWRLVSQLDDPRSSGRLTSLCKELLGRLQEEITVLGFCLR